MAGRPAGESGLAAYKIHLFLGSGMMRELSLQWQWQEEIPLLSLPFPAPAAAFSITPSLGLMAHHMGVIYVQSGPSDKSELGWIMFQASFQ